jgi:uncharacterized protein (TIGR01777 family)
MRNYTDNDVEFVILTRSPQAAKGNVRYIKWDGTTVGNWQHELEGAEAIINLAGRTVNCRYTDENKKQIIDSRVDSTNAVGIAINRCAVPPKVWINAGSAAIFGNSGSGVMVEDSPQGNNFSAQVCKQWEETFNDLITPLTRKVFLRIGMVLGKGGGVLEPFINLARLGLCGKQGNGQQYISWMHEKDFARCIEFAISNNIEGTYNCTAPQPVTNAVFTKTVRQAMGVPFGIPAPALLIQIGGTLIGTEPELLLTGRRVVPQALMQQGFTFIYPEIDAAMREVMA